MPCALGCSALSTEEYLTRLQIKIPARREDTQLTGIENTVTSPYRIVKRSNLKLDDLELNICNLENELNLCDISSLHEWMVHPVVLVINVVDTRIHRPLFSQIIIHFSIHYKILTIA